MLKPFSGKVNQNLQDHLNPKMVIGSIWKLGNKRMFWTLENGIFQFFQIFEWRRWNSFLLKWSKAYLNPKLVLASILESGLQATLREKRKFWTVGNCIFQFFAKFWAAKLKRGSPSKSFCIKSALLVDFKKMLFNFYLIALDNSY